VGRHIFRRVLGANEREETAMASSRQAESQVILKSAVGRPKQGPRRAAVAALAVMLLLGVRAASAQTTFGSIVGSIKDSTGAVLPGATVTASNDATGVTREVTTSGTGDFVVAELLPGTYTVTAKLAGFKTLVRSGVEVRINQAATVDLSMNLGEVTQSVQVTGQVPLLQTADSTVGNVVDQRRIQNLPLNGRDFTQLTLLIPGAAQASLPGSGFFVITAFGTSAAVSGNRPDQNNFTLDGTYNNETFFKHFGIRPSVDSIQEFNIQTNITSARFGVGGAHIDIATRTGTDSLHGTAYEFLRNDVFDASDFFSNASNAKKPAFRMNNFGGSLGGPVFLPKVYDGRKKSFWFFNYERLKFSRESSTLGTVPTAAMLGGDLRFDTAGNPIPQIYNPFTTCGFASNPACATDSKGNPILTRQPFLNNQIPPELIDPVSKIYGQMFYAANPPNRIIPGNTQNLLNTKSQTLSTNQYTVRGDQKITDKWTVFGTWAWSKLTQAQPQDLPTQTRFQINNFRHFTGSGTYVFNPTTVMEIKYGYSLDNIEFHSLYPKPGFQALIDAGFRGVPAKFLGFDTPINLDPADFSSAGLFTFHNGPDKNHQFMGNVMKVYGRNTFNVGMQFRRTAMFHDGQFSNWEFHSNTTADPQNLSGTGYSLASFLLGLPSHADRIIGNAALDGVSLAYYPYIQDDIKVNKKLTINLGLRYEYSEWLKFRYNTEAGYEAELDHGQTTDRYLGYVWSGYNYILGLPHNARREITDPDWNNFAPRFGFAYRWDDRTTIRGGYGVFYAGLMTWEWSQFRGNWPYAVTQTLDGLNLNYPVSRFNNVFPSIDLASVPPSATHTGNRHDRWPYIQEWNLHVQHELANDLLLEVGYVANKGTKLSSFLSDNDPRPGPGTVGCPDVFDLLPAGTCGPNDNHPRPHRNIGPFSANFMGNNSRYHSLQTRLERRFSNGLTMNASYTWSHYIDLASDFSGEGPQDFYNRKLAYGNDDFDLRHNFVFSSLYQLPFGPSRRYLKFHGPLGKLLQGWDLDGIVRFHSGFPYNLGVDTDVANVGARGNFQHPSLIPGKNPNSGPRTTDEWFNIYAFAKCNDKTVFGASTPQYCFGTVGRNTMIGPGFKNFDISLHKTTQISERHAIQFRAEFFNAFNNVNFANPNATFTDLVTDKNTGKTTFTNNVGTISGTANNSREIQFALKYIF
jgi:hypothetical protein